MDCDGCTSCCTLFYVEHFNKQAGTACENCREGSGCQIYNSRPDVCRNFLCAYAQNENLPEDLRPDKCGIIFEKLSDTLFLGTVDHRMKVSDVGLQQINSFNDQGFSVVLKKCTTSEVILKKSEQHNKEDILKEYKELRDMANGKYPNNRFR